MFPFFRLALFLNSNELRNHCNDFLDKTYGFRVLQDKIEITSAEKWTVEAYEKVCEIFNAGKFPLQRIFEGDLDQKIVQDICRAEKKFPSLAPKKTPEIRIDLIQCPRTQKLLTQEFDENLKTIYIQILNETESLSPDLKKALMIKKIVHPQFLIKTAFNLEDFGLLDQSLIDRYPLNCLDFFLTKCEIPEESDEVVFPDRLINQENAFKIISSIFVSRNTKLLQAWPHLLKHLKGKYAVPSTERKEEALHLLKCLTNTCEKLDQLGEDQRILLQNLLKILPWDDIKDDETVLTICAKLKAVPNGAGLPLLTKIKPDPKSFFDSIGSSFDWMKVCFDDIYTNYHLSLNVLQGSPPILSITLLDSALSSDLVMVLKELSPYLQTFNFQQTISFDENTLFFYETYGSKISELRISGKSDSHVDSQLNALLTKCTTLKTLVLSNFTEVNGNSFVPPDSLTYLYIINCQKVSDLPNFHPDRVFLRIVNLQAPAVCPCLTQQSVARFKTIYLENVAINDVSVFNDLLPSQKLDIMNCQLPLDQNKQLLKLLILKNNVSIFLQPFTDEDLQQALEEIKKRPIPMPGIANLYPCLGSNETLLKTYLPLLARKDPRSYGSLYPKIRDVVEKLFPPAAENIALYPVTSSQVLDTVRLFMLTPKPLLDPHPVLEVLSRHSIYKQIIVEFEDSQGVDASGLSRQLISQLFYGLCQQPGEYLYFELRSDGRYLPVLKGELTPDKAAVLRTIGRLLALAAKANGAYPIGEIFPTEFFAALTKVTEEQLAKTSATTKEIADLFSIIADHSSKKLLERYSSILEKKPEEPLNDNEKMILDELAIDHAGVVTTELKKEVQSVADELRQSKLLPLFLIAEGIHSGLPINVGEISVENWDILQHVPAIELATLIQGKMTKEAFLEKILINVNYPHGVVPTPEELVLERERITEIKSWIEEWVRDHTLEELKNVVIAITGATSISLPMKFSVRTADGMMAHTCFNLVDIPNEFTKERFLEQMNEWGAGKGITLFNRA